MSLGATHTPLTIRQRPTDSRTPQVLRLLAGAALLTAAAMGPAGCGHGKYVREGISLAQERRGQIVAGSSWDMANQSYMAGNLDKALKLIDRSLAIKEDIPKSHVLRGRILLEKANFEASLLAFDRAQELDPANVDASYFKGVVHERIAQPEEALTHYRRASELDPDDPQHVIAVAEVLIDLDRIEEAEAFLDESSTKFEHNAGVRQTLGHIAQMTGEPEEAVEYLHQAHLLAPDQSAILEDLVRAQMGVGRFAEAEYNLDRLLSRPEERERRDLRRLQAECLVALDRPGEAHRVLLELTSDEEGKADVESWIQLGIVAWKIGDETRLRTAGTRVVSIDPTRYEGRLLQALYWRGEGRDEEALSALDIAVRLRDDAVTPLLLRAAILQRQGELELARDDLRLVLAEDPTNRRARRLLESVQTTRSRAVAGVSPDSE